MAVVERQQGLNQSNSIDPALQHVFDVCNRDLMLGLSKQAFLHMIDKEKYKQSYMQRLLVFQLQLATQTQTENISMKAKDLN